MRWCSGLVHWDDPEGWDGEGEGFRMGNTCTPIADSCQCMAKPIQYCKVISLQLNKLIFKRKEKKNIRRKCSKMLNGCIQVLRLGPYFFFLLDSNISVM